MKLNFKKIFFLLLSLTQINFICFSQSQKSVAIIKSYSGNIAIKYNNTNIKLSKYLNLFSNTSIIINQDSFITIILKNGYSIYFNEKSNFIIKENELVALDKNSESYIKKNKINIYTEVKNNLKCKSLASSRTIFELPLDIKLKAKNCSKNSIR